MSCLSIKLSSVGHVLPIHGTEGVLFTNRGIFSVLLIPRTDSLLIEVSSVG